MVNSYSIIRALAVALIFFPPSSSANGNDSITSSDYQTLCSIYSDVTKKDLKLWQKEGELAETIQTKIPLFFDRAYGDYLMLSDANMRYQLTKQYAKQFNNIEWECPAARDYYANEFHTD